MSRNDNKRHNNIFTKSCDDIGMTEQPQNLEISGVFPYETQRQQAS